MFRFSVPVLALVTLLLALHSVASPPQQPVGDGSYGEGKSMNPKAESIPNFVRHQSLPRPVSGIRFVVPTHVLQRAANADMPLAFVLGGLSQRSGLAFTGAGGGKGYVPADFESLKIFLQKQGAGLADGVRMSPQAVEWQYSASFDTSQNVTGLTVMVRDLKGAREVVPGTTRVYSIRLSGANEALVIGDFTMRQ